MHLPWLLTNQKLLPVQVCSYTATDAAAKLCSAHAGPQEEAFYLSGSVIILTLVCTSLRVALAPFSGMLAGIYELGVTVHASTILP